MRRPTFGSLFSGIGGLDLGLERAGWRAAWQCEVNDYASRVLVRQWPDVPNLGDITEVDWSSVGQVDLICGGYPCQPFSVTGRRGNDADERHLWPYMLDAVRVLRPRLVLIENVAGHLSLGFDRVLADLAGLGFDAEWSVVSACSMGAPHTRDRLFCVAYPAGFGRAGGWFAELASTPLVERAGYVEASHWTLASQPALVRMAHGVPGGMERLGALGNAVVPQVAQFIGERLLAHGPGER